MTREYVNDFITQTNDWWVRVRFYHSDYGLWV